MRSGLVAALLVLAAAGSFAETIPGGTPPLGVTVRGDTVTATLTGAPLPRVLAEIARLTGAELQGERVPSHDVTVDLHRVPLDEALHRLLGPRSFTLTYARDGRLKRILIGGGPSEGTAAGVVTAPPPAAGGAATTAQADGQPPTADRLGTGEDFQRVGAFLNGDSPVPVRGRLAETLGTRLAPFRDVWKAALTDEDRHVRAQARRAAITALTSDPEVHESWVASTMVFPDDALVTLLRAAGGVDARELAMAFARYGRSDDMTRTMRRALDQMRTPTASAGGS